MTTYNREIPHVWLGGQELVGVESTRPDVPEITYSAGGRSQVCMPGLSAAGKRVYHITPIDATHGGISIRVPFATEAVRAAVDAIYRAGTTIVYSPDDMTTVYTCVFRPGTDSLKATPIDGFAGAFSLEIELDIVSRSAGPGPGSGS